MKQTFYRWCILLCSASLLILCALFWQNIVLAEVPADSDGGFTFYFSIPLGETTVNIKPVSLQDGHFLFVPSGADLSVVRFHCNLTNELFLNGRRLKDGSRVSLDRDSVNTIHFSDQTGTAADSASLFVMQSENLPSLFLNTATGSMENIHSDKSVREKGFLTAFDASGERLEDFAFNSLKGRGNTSWDAPKKSYHLTSSSPKTVLGMGSAQDWVLAANYYDGSYLRNELGYRIAGNAGLPYTPQSRFADLFLNGEYAGLYQIAVKNSSPDSLLCTENDFLAELDYPGRAALEPQVFSLENEQAVVLHSPAGLSKSKIAGIQAWFEEWIAALYAENYRNPDTGRYIFSYLDKESFARMYLMEELLEDMDTGVTSHFFYRRNEADGGLLVDSPLWDLDNTLGRGTDSREPWTKFYAAGHNLSSNNLSRWYARLCANEEFFEEVTTVWKDIYAPFLAQLTDGGIEEAASALLPSVKMDQARWPGIHSQNTPDMDFGDNIAFLKDYLSVRTEFLNRAFTRDIDKTRQFYLTNAQNLPRLVPGAWE